MNGMQAVTAAFNLPAQLPKLYAKKGKPALSCTFRPLPKHPKGAVMNGVKPALVQILDLLADLFQKAVHLLHGIDFKYPFPFLR